MQPCKDEETFTQNPRPLSNNNVLTCDTRREVGIDTSPREQRWDASYQGCQWKTSVFPKLRGMSGCYWSICITPESLLGRFGKDKPAVRGTGFGGWAGAQRNPQWSRSNCLDLEVQSSWQEGQFKQQEPELRLSSIQMKTRDCSKWFSRK